MLRTSGFCIVGFDGRLRPVALNASINDGEIHLRGRERRLWPLLVCSASTTPCTAWGYSIHSKERRALLSTNILHTIFLITIGQMSWLQCGGRDVFLCDRSSNSWLLSASTSVATKLSLGNKLVACWADGQTVPRHKSQMTSIYDNCSLV